VSAAATATRPAGASPPAAPPTDTYTVIGTYTDSGQRFAEVFEDINPGGAEDCALAWAYEQDGSPEILIAGVVRGPCEIVA
jgi:hypothetical protein